MEKDEKTTGKGEVDDKFVTQLKTDVVMSR